MADSGGGVNATVESIVERVRSLNERIVGLAKQGSQESLETYQRLLENVAEAQEAAGTRGAEWIEGFARAQASFTRELAEAFPQALQRIGAGVRGVTDTATEQARKVPGVADAEGAVRGAVSREDDLPIKNYDDLRVEEIVSRLDGLSELDLGKVDAYERRTKNRKTVLDKINSLRA